MSPTCAQVGFIHLFDLTDYLDYNIGQGVLEGRWA